MARSLETPDPQDALTLFHSGEWARALPALRQADEQGGGAEVAAASGICRLLAEGPGEPDEHVTGWDPQATADLLRRGEATGWREIDACQAWLDLLTQRQAHPDEVPPALDLLVSACRQTPWFPLWSMAFRALAYYDRRQAIRDLLPQALTRASDGAWGFALVAAEARLECARQAPGLDGLLRDLDPTNCLPLNPGVAQSWQGLLLAETAWWDGEVPGRTGEIDGDLTEPGPVDDPYSARERRRLTFRATLLAARRAIPGAIHEASRHLEHTHRPDSWECHYLDGLVRWSSHDRRGARQCLEESLAANPFQSRVRFELGALLAEEDPAADPCPESAPGVHDADAAAAVRLFRQGRRTEARERLASLTREEAAFSPRWIWPRARDSRVRQGRELLAHLSEESGNWLEAVRYWDEARHGLDSGKRDPIHRAHRTYLLARHLHDTDRESDRDAADEPEAVALSTHFHKELAKLSLRTLLGDAMFYRGLAAAPTSRERAVADWRALVRQSAWLDASRRRAPERLLHLGDRLLREGFRDDACVAFDHARGGPGARERRWLSALARQDDEASSGSEADGESAPGEAQYLCVRALSRLAREPDDAGVGDLPDQARELGLPPRWQALATALAELARGPVASGAGLEESALQLLPPVLRAGFESLYRPRGLATLQACREAFGPQWKSWCPVSPEELVTRQLEACCQRRDALAAEELMRGAEELGLEIAEQWRVHVLLTKAIRCAFDGDFATAEATRQQAREVLIRAGGQEGDDDDETL